MSCYRLWRPQDNFYYAAKVQLFTKSKDRAYSDDLDDKIDGFHYFTTYIKFGIGRASYDAAQEIRNNHISREEAIALVKKYDGEFAKKYFNEFLEYINISEQKFWELIDNGKVLIYGKCRVISGN